MPLSVRAIRAAIRRRWVVLAVSGALVAVVGGGTAAMAATSTSPSRFNTATATATRTCEPHVRALLRALPRSLRRDLKHLRADAKTARPADRAAIKKKALAGAYGSEIQHVAGIAAGSRGKLAAALPPALKADLKTLRTEPRGSDARRAEAATIWKKAAAGYGATFRAAAKSAEARAQHRCAARASVSGS